MSDTQMKSNGSTELNLVDFFWSTLKHWRAVLAVVLAGGIILGGYGLLKEYREYSDPSITAARKASYEASVEVYEADKARLEKQIENLKSSLARQQKMQETAMILQIDPYNAHMSTASYYVDTNYKIAPELYYQNPDYTAKITNSYIAAIKRLDFDEIISEGKNTARTAMNPVSGSKKQLVNIDTDASNGMFTVTVYADDEQTVDRMMEAIADTVNDMTGTLTLAVGRHTLSLIGSSTSTVADSDFAEIQSTFNESIETNSTALEEANVALDSLEKPTNTAMSKRGILMEVIKCFCIGVIVAAVLAVIVALVFYLLRDRLHCAEELRSRYRGTVLGSVFTEKKKTRKLDKAVLRRLGIQAKPAEEAYAFIAANTKLRLQDKKQILLIGSVGDETLSSVKEGIEPLLDEGTEVMTGGNVIENADAVESLFEDAAVIFVERIMKTPHEWIRLETEVLSAAQKDVLGFILCN